MRWAEAVAVLGPCASAFGPPSAGENYQRRNMTAATLSHLDVLAGLLQRRPIAQGVAETLGPTLLETHKQISAATTRKARGSKTPNLIC